MDEVTNQLPSVGSFGSMSRDQIIEMAKHPPKSGGNNADPLASVTASARSAPALLIKAYHKKRDIVVTVLHTRSDKATVMKDDGTTFTAAVANLRML